MNTQFTKSISFLTLILLILLLQVSPVQAQGIDIPIQAGVTWYVATTGSVSNDCLTPSTPCLTINGAIGKSNDGDFIKVAEGIYTSLSGDSVVEIHKDITLSGGWDESFVSQVETSTIDGQNTRSGIYILNAEVVIERFTIQNGSGSGISTGNSVITINKSYIKNNKSQGSGGGISNANSTMTINDTVISGNQGGDECCGGGGGGAGIYNHNSGTLTLNRSAVLNNKLVGGFSGSGINSLGNVNVILNNSTISGNLGGEGIYTFTGMITINSSTIFNNQYEGIVNIAGDVNLQNTILAGNGGKGDCYNDATYQGSVISLGYNLIGNGDKCGIMTATGDKIGTASNPIDPKLSQYPIFPIGFHILAPDSPAINSADPGTCPLTDQRGVTRPQGGGCDIGAYEYGAVAGPATTIGVYSGTDQSAYFGRPFSNQLSVYVLDANGTPVNGVNVTFSAPTNGPSGTFANAKAVIQDQPQLDFARLNIGEVSSLSIYEATVKTVGGVAYAPVFKSNFQEGSYTVKATVSTLGLSTTFTLNNLPLNNSFNYLQNGGFEDPVTGNYWNGYSSIFGDPFCTLETCGNGGGTAGPLSGSTWVWFGGVPAPYMEQGEITQYSFVIPKGPAHLRFYLWIGYAHPDSDANDKLTVTFSHKDNDFVIFTVNATQQNLYPSYTLVDIDLSQYADNETHYIKFSAGTHAHLVNFNLDDISINDSAFIDIPPNYWARQYVERLYSAGITGGCITTPLTYCPSNPVTRAQMAVFLLKGIHGSNFTPLVVGTSTGFNDVTTTHWAAAWIKQLAAEAITSGCGSGIYCPENTVTRAQMAVFLLKAKHGASYIPPNVTATFGDTSRHWAEDWIEQLAAEGITSGCGGGNYCPDNPVTRDQMAVFLVKAFNLP